METLSSLSPKMTVLFSLFGLAWFLTGLLAGRLTGRASVPSGGEKRHFQRRPSPGGSAIEIYVGNLSYDVSERDMEKEFGAFGSVASVRIIEDKFSGKSKGFGFVEMPERAQATEAIRALNGKDLKGRRVVVNEARSRARDED